MVQKFSLEVLVTVLGCINVVTSRHFRGGSIFWKPTGNSYEVEFSAKLGYEYGWNSCSSSNLNRPSTNVAWKCVSGCPVNGTVVNANRPGFTCTGFDIAQDWERTESTFSYVFPGAGTYVIEYTDRAWINALGSGDRRLTTTVNLHSRSDTHAPNFSPVVPAKPNCDLTIDATQNKSGVYALAITIEDKPTSIITIGSTPYAPSRVISSVPLQFVLLTPDLPTRSCSDKPIFLDTTPSQNDVLVYRQGDIVYLSFYATSRATTIRSFTLLDPPINVRQSALRNDDRFRPAVYTIDITWSPVAADRGSKTICVEATDNYA
ncbi:LOW QUALITY PROTEIN: hypothetical protein MAR_013368 [Mya arenaria]|uniref:Uncharacterized protein n=1 Tax=Mya arenaria TaxID=6604 RepID=A0ABY7G323_MYAAR|nr:LOW QUALITY PROTEIN: hypothetical protein MAR_013368 [Mya arenaria]